MTSVSRKKYQRFTATGVAWHQVRSSAALLMRALRRAWSRSSANASLTAPLLTWARHFLPHYCTRPPSAMHRWLESTFEGLASRRGVKLNVIGPRGSAKSTIGALAWPLRLAVEGREPYIWIISDTSDQAQSHLQNLKRELLDNPRIRHAYPAAARRGTGWREDSITLANGVVLEAFGTGQHIRGRRRGAYRPTLIICDDLQNDQHMTSATLRESSRHWFHGNLLKAGSSKTNVLHLATALHHDALALELTRTPGWTSRVFRAIERWPDAMAMWQEWETIYCRPDDPQASEKALAFYDLHRAQLDAGAELLWPEEEPLYALMCMRVESGRAAFEREKQGSPLNPELCEWPEELFDDAQWFDDWPATARIKVLALDPSKGSTSKLQDYSAYVLLTVDAQGTLFVEADLARRSIGQLVDDGAELWGRFRPDVFGLETNQFQELLGPQFQEAFRRRGWLVPPTVGLDNRTNKLVRIRRLGPYLSARRIMFKAGSPSTRLLVQQLRDFPLADHDDGPDALEMAVRLAAAGLAPGGNDRLGSHLPIHVP